MSEPAPHRSLRPGLASIMMPAFEAENYIGRAIASALDQTYPDWELIVVDDGSRDRTAAIAGEIPDPRVRLLIQPNAGEATARNRALAEVGGEFLAFLDADDELAPDHLALTVARLRAEPHLGGVFTDGEVTGADGRPTGLLSQRRRGTFDGDLFEPLVRSSDVIGPPGCVVLRTRAVLARPIEFDRRIVIGPDWDFLTAVAEAASFGRIDRPTYRYRLHAGSITSRVDPATRRRSLALCREKSIRRARFSSLSIETRSYVFYDLLVRLLDGFPDHQESLTRSPEFSALPAGEQAKILRLMATGALLSQGTAGSVRGWFQRARVLAPADRRIRVVASLFEASPRLCSWLLRVRRRSLMAGAPLDASRTG